MADNEDDDHITVKEIEIYLRRQRAIARLFSSRGINYEETLKSWSSSSSTSELPRYLWDFFRRLRLTMTTVRKLGGPGKATAEAIFETMKNDFPDVKDELSLKKVKTYLRVINVIENRPFDWFRPNARFFAIPGVVATAENERGGFGPMRRARSRSGIGSDPYGSILDRLKGLNLEPGLDPCMSVLDGLKGLSLEP